MSHDSDETAMAAGLMALGNDSPPVGAGNAGSEDDTIAISSRHSARMENFDFGEYVLEQEIARGGMGVVYRAFQKRLKRKVAVKLIRSALLASEEEVRRFKIEAEAAAGLDHPNIMPIYEIGEVDGQHFFTMRLLEGGTLQHVAGRDRRELARLLAKVARAVHAAHQSGILHRDLKPGNILLDDHGEPFVTDFGIAKQLESDSGLTLEDQMMGTPSYMAPEQATSGKAVTTAADVYGLGAILYELLTGQPPFKGKSAVETLQQVTDTEAVRPRSRDASIDLDLETITLKCLEKEPQRRYQSAAALADDLERWANHETILARPATTADRLRKWCKRRPTQAALVALALVFLVTLLVGGPIIAIHQSRLTRTANEQKDTIQQNLYFAEMNLAGVASRESAGLSTVERLTQKWTPAPGQPDLRGWEWHYLRSLLHQEKATLSSGELTRPRCVDWSPDGTRLVVAGPVTKAQIWDRKSGRVIHTLVHSSGVADVAWSPDGRWIASSTHGGRLYLWNAASGETVATWLAHTADPGIIRVLWHPDSRRLVSTGSGKDGGLKCWDMQEKKLLWELPNTIEGNLLRFSWNPDGSKLAVSGLDFPFTLLNGSDGNKLAEYPFPWKDVRWSPDGQWIAGVTANRLQIWDVRQEKMRADWQADDIDLQSIAWSADSRHVVSGGEDFCIRVWQADTGQLVKELKTNGVVNDVAWRPDSKEIAAVGEHIGLTLWDWQPHAADGPQSFDQVRDVTAVTWSPSGDRVAVGSRQGAWIFDSHDQSLRQVLDKGGQERVMSGVESISWAADNGCIAAGRMDGKISLFDPNTGRELHHLDGHSTPALVAWSPDGQHLVSAPTFTPGMERKVSLSLKIWNRQSGKEVRHLDTSDWFAAVAWHPTQPRIAFLSWESDLWVIDSQTLETLLKVSTQLNDRGTLCWSADGSQIAVGGRDRQGSLAGIQIWDVATGKQRLVLRGHHTKVTSLAWSPDGQRLASGEAQGIVNVWDPKTGGMTLSLPVLKTQRQLPMAWSPDSQRLLIGSSTGLRMLGK